MAGDYASPSPHALSACMLTVASFAVILAGCNQHVRGRTVSGTPKTYSSVSSGSRTRDPLPDKALLGRLPEPDCKFKTSEADTDDRQKLDYERQCYRRAEEECFDNGARRMRKHAAQSLLRQTERVCHHYFCGKWVSAASKVIIPRRLQITKIYFKFIGGCAPVRK